MSGRNADFMSAFRSFGCFQREVSRRFPEALRESEQTDSSRVHGTDFESRRVQAEDFVLEFFGGREGLVAQVGLVLKGKGEFAVGELASRGVRLVQPEEHGLPRQEARVVGSHDHRVGQVAHGFFGRIFHLGEHGFELIVGKELVERCRMIVRRQSLGRAVEARAHLDLALAQPLQPLR